ncbi:MAG: hypothetical protein ACTSWG_10370 [Candidatus Helarchaeota archaeon]
MSLFDKNKIIITYNLLDKNESDITKLENKDLYKVQKIWAYKSQTVTLLENYYSTTINEVFQLENVSEDILKNIKPIVYVTNGLAETDDGFPFSDSVACLLDTHFLMTSSTTANLYVKGLFSALTKDNNVISIHWFVKLIYKPLLKRQNV